MKKLFLIVIFASIIQVSYAQMTNEKKSVTTCSEQALNDLSSCLSSKGITYIMSNDGSGTVYITAEGNPPPGHIQSCIAHYNQLRKDCPEAPEVVYIKSNKGKKND